MAGNAVQLLRDGPQVFPAWLADIAAARRFILFENYIFKSDRIGQRVADALIERAQAGVKVCLLYDAFGCIGTSRVLWRRLQQAGVELRAFNPLHLLRPVRAFQRDHRKGLCIDGAVGFVGGLCVGDDWAGDPERGVAPWRDTAVRIAGPACQALVQAFNETWCLCGPSLPEEILDDRDGGVAQAGGSVVRVVSGLPARSRIFRVFQMLLTTAASRIWITDAYFVTPPTMYEALVAAAHDGVDVRVLVPGRSDLPWVAWLGRSSYTGLLEAGVRIFEWDGPMLHAKTSVIDGQICRVGSSNLNLASLLANWELDVTIEDPRISADMEAMFEEDLSTARELYLLSRPRRFRQQPRLTIAETEAAAPREQRGVRVPRGRHAATVVARAGAAMLGVALRRQYQQSSWSVATVFGLVLLGLGGLGLWRPVALGLPLAVICLWLGLGALGSGLTQWRHNRRRFPPKEVQPAARSPAEAQAAQAPGEAQVAGEAQAPGEARAQVAGGEIPGEPAGEAQAPGGDVPI